jgi:hypothetical protein
VFSLALKATRVELTIGSWIRRSFFVGETRHWQGSLAVPQQWQRFWQPLATPNQERRRFEELAAPAKLVAGSRFGTRVRIASLLLQAADSMSRSQR